MAVHRLTDSAPPRGWSAHICEGVGAQLGWLRQVRLLRVRDLPLGVELDLTPHLALTIGNVLSAARVGATARLGWGLTGDFGGLEDDALALPLAPLDAPRARSHPFGVWLVGRVDVRGVAFDVTLEGSPFDAVGPLVRREPLVASAEAGVVIAIGQRVLLGYTHTFRTREFEDQRAPDAFGALFFQLAF